MFLIQSPTSKFWQQNLGGGFLNCDVILSNEETFDYLTFVDPDEKSKKIIGERMILKLEEMKSYIEWKKGILIDIKGYDIIESNIDGNNEEYLIYYL